MLLNIILSCFFYAHSYCLLLKPPTRQHFKNWDHGKYWSSLRNGNTPSSFHNICIFNKVIRWNGFPSHSFYSCLLLLKISKYYREMICFKLLKNWINFIFRPITLLKESDRNGRLNLFILLTVSSTFRHLSIVFEISFRSFKF